MVAMIFSVCIGGILISAAVSDALHLRVPNMLSLALVLVFALQAYASAMPFNDILRHILAGATVFGFGFVLFAVNIVGAGDVKLMSAVSLVVGWTSLLSLLTTVAAVGGVLALLIIWLGSWGIISNSKVVPYAIAIAAGWFVVGSHLISI
jgi:prepilin peptidase CpaA